MRPGYRAWTEEEDFYLEEKWGTVSIPSMAKRLNRSELAVITRARKMKLGPFLESGEYVALNTFLKAIGYQGGSAYKMKSWVKNRGFPLSTKMVNTYRFKVVYIDKFWEWAEKNRCFLDFSKIPPLILGKEPDWVAEQRKKDAMCCSVQRKDRWTGMEDALLRQGVQDGMTYVELVAMLGRTSGAILKRCIDLGMKERPVRKSPHDTKWTTKQMKIVEDGIRAADSYGMIALKVDRSEKAVRGFTWRTYGTEDLDKIRAMLKDAG